MAENKITKQKIKQLQDEKILMDLDLNTKEKNELLTRILSVVAHEAQQLADKKFKGHPGLAVMFMDVYLNNFILNLLARANHLKTTYTMRCADVIHSEKEQDDIPYIGG